MKHTESARAVSAVLRVGKTTPTYVDAPASHRIVLWEGEGTGTTLAHKAFTVAAHTNTLACHLSSFWKLNSPPPRPQKARSRTVWIDLYLIFFCYLLLAFFTHTFTPLPPLPHTHTHTPTRVLRTLPFRTDQRVLQTTNKTRTSATRTRTRRQPYCGQASIDLTLHPANSVFPISRLRGEKGASGEDRTVSGSRCRAWTVAWVPSFQHFPAVRSETVTAGTMMQGKRRSALTRHRKRPAAALLPTPSASLVGLGSEINTHTRTHTGTETHWLAGVTVRAHAQ